MDKKTYKTIDLFAGVGGIRLGFEETNRFETVFANDFDKFCKHTYDANFDNTKLNNEDLRKFAENPDQIPEFDILLGGFPCQPFSIAGYREGFEDEEKGTLFFEMFKIIKHHKPKVLLLENVKNLKGHDDGNTFRVIKESLEKIGYKIYDKVLNSLEHANVPQNRERIFIVGFRDDIKNKEDFKFPSRVPLERSFREFLENNVDDKYYYDDRYKNFDKMKKEIKSEKTVYQWRRVYVRENKSGVCPTLTANMGMGGHNVPLIKEDSKIRKLTPKECFNLQGYPSYFSLPDKVSDTQLYKQAGNSVTVPLVKRIALSILEVLDSDFNRTKIEVKMPINLEKAEPATRQEELPVYN